MIDLTAASGGSVGEIWVAAGTYKPAHVPQTASHTTNRDRTFLLKPGVKLYGGFSGSETALTQRNWESNASVLSGDFNNNDMGNAKDGFGGMGENAYHVVVSVGIPNDGETVLDGFTIKGGTGGGSITVGGTSIGHAGGGMSNNSSSPVLINVTISGNQAGSGGGMYNNDSSSPVLTNVTISGNQASGSGGGMYNYDSSPVLTNVTISGNYVTDNSSIVGVGMYNVSSSPVLTNVTISGNYATSHGGGMSNASSSPVLTNVTISDNQAGHFGGGMYNYDSSPKIRNSIIWGNSGSDNVYNSGSIPTYAYSLVEGLNPSDAQNSGNNMDGTDAANDPLFVSPASYPAAPTTAGDYHLQSGSPVINQGGNSFYNASQTPDLSDITTDRDGNPRFKGAAVDMGAYEY
jgi:hypothetical protein